MSSKNTSVSSEVEDSLSSSLSSRESEDDISLTYNIVPYDTESSVISVSSDTEPEEYVPKILISGEDEMSESGFEDLENAKLVIDSRTYNVHNVGRKAFRILTLLHLRFKWMSEDAEVAKAKNKWRKGIVKRRIRDEIQRQQGAKLIDKVNKKRAIRERVEEMRAKRMKKKKKSDKFDDPTFGSNWRPGKKRKDKMSGKDAGVGHDHDTQFAVSSRMSNSVVLSDSVLRHYLWANSLSYEEYKSGDQVPDSDIVKEYLESRTKNIHEFVNDLGPCDPKRLTILPIKSDETIIQEVVDDLVQRIIISESETVANSQESSTSSTSSSSSSSFGDSDSDSCRTGSSSSRNDDDDSDNLEVMPMPSVQKRNNFSHSHSSNTRRLKGTVTEILNSDSNSNDSDSVLSAGSVQGRQYDATTIDLDNDLCVSSTENSFKNIQKDPSNAHSVELVDTLNRGSIVSADEPEPEPGPSVNMMSPEQQQHMSSNSDFVDHVDYANDVDSDEMDFTDLIHIVMQQEIIDNNNDNNDVVPNSDSESSRDENQDEESQRSRYNIRECFIRLTRL